MIATMKARAVHCSFCGKSRGEVDNIVAGAPHTANARRGQSSFICNECVCRFNELLTSNEASDTLVSASTVK